MKQQAEAFIDSFIEKHGKPPSYLKVAGHLKLSKSHTYSICKDFREKMAVNEKKQDKSYSKEPHPYYPFISAIDRMDQNLNRLATLIN